MLHNARAMCMRRSCRARNLHTPLKDLSNNGLSTRSAAPFSRAVARAAVYKLQCQALESFLATRERALTSCPRSIDQPFAHPSLP